MATGPRCSVVIPTHDTRSLTLECVASIVGDADVHVIVVDDGSRDGTAEAIEERFPEVEVVRLRSAAGFTAAANLGLSRARGDLLVLLNSDTLSSSAALRALMEAMDTDRALGIAGGRLSYPDGRPQWSGGAEPTLPWLFGLASGLPRWLGRLPGYRRLRPVAGSGAEPMDVAWVTGAAMGIRRQVWREVGPLDPSFRFYCQDLDFCVRARQAGWGVGLVPEFEVTHHHGGTIGRAPGAVSRQHLEVLWSDLVLWARKHRGPGWAARAVTALRWGTLVRLAARKVREHLLPRGCREGWRRDSLAYRRALTSLSQSSS